MNRTRTTTDDELDPRQLATIVGGTTKGTQTVELPKPQPLLTYTLNNTMVSG